MADDQTPHRPVPDRPVPDRGGAPGGGFSGGSSNTYGMTWIALAALVFMVLVVGWRLFDFWDSRQPPSGVATQEATVLGFEELGPSRAGSRAAEYSSVVFELPGGEQESALYELRRIGDLEKGDAITVYEEDGEWRTTTEKAWGGTIGWALGMVALLAMIAAWFRVRLKVRKGESPL
jgi:hypothetical protein